MNIKPNFQYKDNRAIVGEGCIISASAGAMLEFLEGKTLPGIAPVEE